MNRMLALLLAALAAVPVAATAPAPLGLTELLAGTAGTWQGELQYRDYQSNAWIGLPMTVTIAVQPDRVTLLRTATYDDGPQTGLVYITTASMLDAAAGLNSYAVFRVGRSLDSGAAAISLDGTPRDAQHWTIIATETRRDGNGLAQVRETTVRDGARLVTLKEVNPLDDGKDEWLPRNRTVLNRVTAAAQ